MTSERHVSMLATPIAFSRVPPSYQAEPIRSHLSVDGQVYTRCTACGFEERWQPHPDGWDRCALADSCPACGAAGQKSFVQHLLRDQGSCLDCDAEFDEISQIWVDLRCPRCGSMRLQVTQTGIEPPFPSRFGEAVGSWPFESVRRADHAYVWGESGIEDAKRLNAQVNTVSTQVQAPAYRFVQLLFAERLRTGCDYQDWEARYWITNVQANHAQAYFRETGLLPMGVQVVRLFMEMAQLPPDAGNRGLALHSFAMGVYSLLSQYHEDYVSAIVQIPGVRGLAIEAAEEAAMTFERLVAEGAQGASQQLARIRWVMGDLLRVGHTDDDQRHQAIELFDQAMEDPKVESRFGWAIAQSRGHTIAELTELDQALLDKAIDDLNRAAGAGGSDQAYANRWRSQQLLGQLVLRYGDWHQALPMLQTAASQALQQFQFLGNEFDLLHQAEQFSVVFEGLASLYVGLGWVDEALALIQITRGVSIRLYTMNEEDRKTARRETMARSMEDLWPASLKDAGLQPITSSTSDQHIDDYLEEHPVGPDVKALLGSHKDEVTGYLVLVINRGVVSAMLCTLEGADAWRVDETQWSADEAELEQLSEERYVQPGPFRERLLRKACKAGFSVLIEPALGKLEAHSLDRLILSVPGKLSRLPFEAFLSPDGKPLTDLAGPAISYVPSLRLGADLVGYGTTPAQSMDKVLLVGYDGDDLATKDDELLRLRELWGSRLTYLPGEDCTKRRVLEELAGDYDLIHIQGHGTYDQWQPLMSALHFTADPQDDRRRVTAFDLLTLGRFPKTPLVSLSACSSAITADSRTNSFHGLLGSLLRIGAVGVVGSRWPVHDDAAASLMNLFHQELAVSGKPPDHSLAVARGHLRDRGLPMEDWAAFGYFGA